MGGQLEGSGSVHKRHGDGLDKSSGREDVEKGMNSRDIQQEKSLGFGNRLDVEVGGKGEGITRMICLAFSQEDTLLFCQFGGFPGETTSPLRMFRDEINAKEATLLPHSQRNRIEVALASIWLHLLPEPTSAISSIFLTYPGFLMAL